MKKHRKKLVDNDDDANYDVVHSEVSVKPKQGNAQEMSVASTEVNN